MSDSSENDGYINQRKIVLAKELKEETELKIMERERLRLGLKLHDDEILKEDIKSLSNSVAVPTKKIDYHERPNKKVDVLKHTESVSGSHLANFVDTVVHGEADESEKCSQLNTNGQFDNIHKMTSSAVFLENKACTDGDKEESFDRNMTRMVSHDCCSDDLNDEHSNAFSCDKKCFECNEDSQTLFYRHLRSGFYFSLQKNNMLEGVKIDVQEQDSIASFSLAKSDRLPLINFIDPTSIINNSNHSNMPATSPSRRRAWNREKPKPRINHLQIFHKINMILEQRYGSTLENINYHNPTTNMVESIERLPIRTQLTAPMVTDAANWHEDPLCHVYIAACYSVDHYREKVRPAIRAFVNQIDGAASGNESDVISAASNAAKKEFGAKKNSDNKRLQVVAATKAVAAAKDAAAPSASSQYMIIFVPINSSSIESDVSPIEDLPNEVGIGFRGRFAAAGRRVQLKEPNDDDEVVIDSIHDSEIHSNQVMLLSKEHREIYKRIRRDFERGETAILSTLLDSENNLLEESTSQNQEFHVVLQQLARTLLSGFYDRIEKYNDELKRCERSSSKWSRYLLLKESLSFSFEQMQLPYQAIREYEELESILPVGNIVSDAKKDSGAYFAAIVGNSNDFRPVVRDTDNFEEIYEICMLYIVSRKINIFFLNNDPVGGLKSIYRYIKRSYAFRCDLLKSMNHAEKIHQFAVKSEALAMSLCWDVKLAAEPFYLPILLRSTSIQAELSPRSQATAVEIIKIIHKLFDFLRIRSLRLSQIRFSHDNVINKSLIHRKSTFNSWIPWEQIEILEHITSVPQSSKPCFESSVLPFFDNDQIFNSFIKDIYNSEQKFQTFLINIYESLVLLNKFLKRERYMCRILADLAEVYICQNEVKKSVENLLLVIDNCANDPWDKVLSWRVFRLLLCQRKHRNAAEYFKTAAYFLGLRLYNSVPDNIKLIQRDLNTLVSFPDVAELRWPVCPLFGVDIFGQESKSNNTMNGSTMTNIIFQKCKVGETARITLVVSSKFAEDIVLDRIELIILTLSRYQDLVDGHRIVDKTDAAFVLAIDKPVQLPPGKSLFCFSWVATNVDQFVVSSIRFQWKETTFHHDYAIQKQNDVCGFSVQPNEPTQRISINPVFLIPGHTQTVQLTFHAGKDVINRGDVQLKCSRGLKVKMENSNSDWQETCRFSFNSCKPTGKLTFVAEISSESISSYSDIRNVEENREHSTLQTLEAIVTTSYNHDVIEEQLESVKHAEVMPMTAILETSVRTLERAVLTLEKTHFFTIDSCTAIINISILCNAPVPFVLKRWNISLPKCISLHQDGDTNDCLRFSSVIEGDRLHFTFRCIISEHEKKDDELRENFGASLNIVLNDSCGESFHQVIPIDISSLCCKTVVDFGESIDAKLLLGQREGLVGEPVAFTYNLQNISYVSKDIHRPQMIIYRLLCNDHDWIIAGNVCGSIKVSPDDNEIDLHFIAIPTKCGKIESFPDLHLSWSDYRIIKVVTKQPISFLSRPYKTIDGIGFPS